MKKEMTKCERCRNRNLRTVRNQEPSCKLNMPQFSIETDVDCENFDSRYIEYPLTIEGIDNQFSREKMYSFHECGSLVRISPCADEFKGKTYLGILLGDLPIGAYIAFNREDKKLRVAPDTNPAIFVPEIKKIIYGCESWWGEIESPKELKDITNEEINNQWYVRLLKDMTNIENQKAAEGGNV